MLNYGRIYINEGIDPAKNRKESTVCHYWIFIYVMVAMVWQLCILIYVILLLSLLRMLIIVALLTELANLKQSTC